MAGKALIRTRLILPWVLAILLAALGGCRGGKGHIRGHVYYKDKALTSGVVTFIVKGKSGGVAPIQEDGAYEVKNVPAGEATITVSTAPGANLPGTKGSKSPPVEIPPLYGDPAKSPERYTVTSGDQEYDIKLK